MPSRESSLPVYISGIRCGTLFEDNHGALSFEYEQGYRGVPLSLSMPVGLARFNDKTVRPYLMGLLPDDAETRASIGGASGISGENPFHMLGLIGLDCPGAVQVCAESSRPPAQDGGDLKALTDAEMERCLAALKENAASAWLGPKAEGHWSLGGCQAKIALRYEGDKWYECLGTSATTHILKPGVTGYDNQALVEYLSMKIAEEIGLPVARVAHLAFGQERAIVVERYDRARDERGDVVRIHQEDLCQAMGIYPTSKYAEQGGPTTPKIIDLLKRTGPRARENVYRFTLYLFFNYLIGATDAHGKNHSLLHVAPDDIRIAPLYDVASMAPYRSLRPTQRKPLRAALSIGGENRFGLVGSNQIDKMTRDCQLEDLGLSSDLLKSRFKTMATVIPQALEKVLGEARTQEDIEILDTLGKTMCQEIGANCQRTLDRLA
jgi:serine/threonine-protein kinase HipA